MGVLEIIGGILLLVASVIIIFVIMLQESKTEGIGALTGSSDTYVGRNGAKTKEAFLVKLTKILAVAFFVVALAMNVILKFF